jgi:gamma-glutamyltranspeptidase/glutathione hydrolase
MKKSFLLLSCLCLLLASLPISPADAETARAEKGMVATVHPLATDAGVAVLEKGGNAIDAAIAAGLMLGVVDNHNSGIGGGCFILIRRADGQLFAIDGREMAPAMAHRDMYLEEGKPQGQWSRTGALASGVPGALAAYERAITDHGRTAWRELVMPAARVAADGFVVDAVYARKLASVATTLARFEGSRAALLDENGRPHVQGTVLKQPDLAATYRQVAEGGSRAFYQGPFAEACHTWMKQNGGILTRGDLAGYRPGLREPIVSRYRGHTIVGFPSPSSGGIHVAQILNILESFDLGRIYHEDRARFTHVVAEAMKLAFADRAHWLGDADFVPVPRGLIDRRYARLLSRQINPLEVTPLEGHHLPPRADSDLFGSPVEKHTTHVAVADSEGNWVAMTQTVNTTFGSKVVIPGTGVVMNNEMDDFSIAPGIPNAFGLLGGEANSIAPGKRPLSSMSPTVVLRRGEPVLTLGAAGGPKIITQVLLGIICHIDLEMSLEEQMDFERFHHQWRPDRLYVESSLPAPVVAELESRGHTISRSRSVGITQAIKRDPETGEFHGAHDPRVPGKAAGPR